MTHSDDNKKLRFGCLQFILKIGAIILGVYAIELTGQWVHHKFYNNELNQALTPFHNNYFSFSGYYLTEQGMGSEFSSTPTATLRFFIYGILSYLLYGGVSMIIRFLPVVKKYSDKINTGLFYVIILFSFLLAFLFPDKKTVIDPDTKTITITRYNYFFIPVTGTLSWDAVEDIGYEIISDYDGYNKQYIYYLEIFLNYSGHKKMRMGEMEVGKQKGTLQEKPEWHESKKIMDTGDYVVSLLKQKVGLPAQNSK